MTRLNRMLVALVLLGGYEFTGGAALGAEQLPECAAVCDESADCFEECEFGTESGWVFTICGEYESGSALGYCDHATWDTCNYLCDFGGDEETACLLDGVQSTCEAYGIYLSYNDGYCSPEEYCGSSNDCGTCLPEPPAGLGPAIATYGSNLEIKTACEIASSAPYNYVSGWDCPSDEWLTELGSGPGCAVKEAALAAINTFRIVLENFARYPLDFPWAAGAVWAINQIYNSVSAEPCYLWT